MYRLRTLVVLLLAALALLAAACGETADETASDTPTEAATTEAAPEVAETEMEPEPEPTDEPEPEPTDEMAMGSSAEACDADAIVAMVEGGPAAGTLAGMSEDPVATAASNNPVLTTLATAVGAAGLGDTLNGAEALTVFAPTDCAFAALDPATLDAALADPEGLLTQVLGFHVVVGERLADADLGGVTEVETFTGEMLSIEVDGDTVRVGGQADVLVPDIQTGNATVHLIDAVMIPGEG